MESLYIKSCLSGLAFIFIGVITTSLVVYTPTEGCKRRFTVSVEISSWWPLAQQKPVAGAPGVCFEFGQFVIYLNFHLWFLYCHDLSSNETCFFCATFLMVLLLLSTHFVTESHAEKSEDIVYEHHQLIALCIPVLLPGATPNTSEELQRHWQTCRVGAKRRAEKRKYKLSVLVIIVRSKESLGIKMDSDQNPEGTLSGTGLLYLA